MSYKVRFTDRDKADLTVFDLVGNNETSLEFPGRNSTNYGQVIAENFLHLLENFASSTEPRGAIEGQLWYDSAAGSLKISDGVTWKSAGGILKGPEEPSTESSQEGELWIDTLNQQLRIFNGDSWILVGPTQSYIDGQKYGPSVEFVRDTDDNLRSVIKFYVADIPVSIISKDSFRPKLAIPGYTSLRAGININSPLAGTAEAEEFDGGFLPRLNGVAYAADNLQMPNSVEPVPATRFLRSDQINTTDFAFNVRNNLGISLGVNQNLKISTSATEGRIYNSAQNSSINVQINRNGNQETILAVTGPLTGGAVGINKITPTEALDVLGNIKSSGNITSTNGNLSIPLGSATIGLGLTVNGILEARNGIITTNIIPTINQASDIGSSTKRYNTIYAKKVIAENIEGVVNNPLDPTAVGVQLANKAKRLELTTEFKIEGDVLSNTISFDGQIGNPTKIFNTTLSEGIINNKTEPPGRISKSKDFVLIFREQSPTEPVAGLLKLRRDDFIGDLGIPIGAILPYTGQFPPRGYLFCDGSEVEIATYPELHRVIGQIYRDGRPLIGPVGRTFRLPDLRGRFPLGVNIMDNNIQIPNVVTGSYVDGGGGDARDNDDPTQDRVVGAALIGLTGGNSTKGITVANLPDHEHTLQADGRTYSAIRVDTAISSSSSIGPAPSLTDQAQYLPQTGGIKTNLPNIEQKFNVMNPYLTIHYIIRSGPPETEVVTN